MFVIAGDNKVTSENDKLVKLGKVSNNGQMALYEVSQILLRFVLQSIMGRRRPRRNFSEVDLIPTGARTHVLLPVAVLI